MGYGQRVRELTIRGETIRLGQLLKLAGLVDSGGEVKTLLAERQVQVNGEAEVRRGRQLRAGDLVAVEGEELRVSAGPQAGS
jgi:ribosome-associated protein